MGQILVTPTISLFLCPHSNHKNNYLEMPNGQIPVPRLNAVNRKE